MRTQNKHQMCAQRTQLYILLERRCILQLNLNQIAICSHHKKSGNLDVSLSFVTGISNVGELNFDMHLF